MLFEGLIILCLIGINGYFSLAELAVLSASKSRLIRHHSDDNRIALHFLEHSGSFLATTQIGITLVGILTGVFSGETMAQRLQLVLQTLGVPAAWSRGLALSLVVLMITFLTLVFGKLLPKQIALHAPEKIARRVAGPIQLMSRLAAPLVKLLSLTTGALLRLLRLEQVPDDGPDHEDMLQVLQEGQEAGSLSLEAQRLVECALKLDSIPIKTLMLPRQSLICLNLADSAEAQRLIISKSYCADYLVCSANGTICGLVALESLLPILQSPTFDYTPQIRQALYLTSSLSAAQALGQLREHGCQEAFVIDQQHQIQGLLRLKDILLVLAR